MQIIKNDSNKKNNKYNQHISKARWKHAYIRKIVQKEKKNMFQ